MEAKHIDQEAWGQVLPVEPEGIWPPLKVRPQWVVWRLEERDGKLTKVPYSPWSGERASTTDLLTWAAFDEALAVYHSGGYQGVGFVFCSADPYVGIDLDGCRDPESGATEGWARTVVDRFAGGYVEASPSGKGVHVIVAGRLRDGKRRGAVEMYGQERFFTITGVAI